jgi:hypothetical protein
MPKRSKKKNKRRRKSMEAPEMKFAINLISFMKHKPRKISLRERKFSIQDVLLETTASAVSQFSSEAPHIDFYFSYK